MEKEVIGLLDIITRGGVPGILLVIVYFQWKENQRLTRLVEKNAEYTLELLLKMNRVVGKFNRIAGGGGEDDDSEE